MEQRKIVIVGGGVASLVAGIELRDRLPGCRVELITDAEPDHFGGQVASWDEHGYPIEHGLHALFGFYDEILPLLERVGALDNFTPSPKYVNVFERGSVHRFRPKTWLATYTGFSMREKLGLARCLPALARFVAAVKRDDSDAFDAYDRYDLREFLRKEGVPDSMLQSSFVRSLYDAPFNNPYTMSAAMGLQSLYRIFERPWHYHFNQPARVALVDPLRRYFLEACGGTIRYRTRLERVGDAGGGRPATPGRVLTVRQRVRSEATPRRACRHLESTRMNVDNALRKGVFGHLETAHPGSARRPPPGRLLAHGLLFPTLAGSRNPACAQFVGRRHRESTHE